MAHIKSAEGIIGCKSMKLNMNNNMFFGWLKPFVSALRFMIGNLRNVIYKRNNIPLHQGRNQIFGLDVL